jgi:putative addiction module component (TIGR02574 family)
VSDPKRLFEEALHLPVEERAALAGVLIESLDLEVDDEVEAAWSAEISRRLERVDAGVAKTIPWSVFLPKLAL